ncbi:MAG: response regulator, partial [Anaerolineales bacterium]|nr:response regulator [Anaerolineales bacterium]
SLIVSDRVMPGMGGLELARTLQADPDAPPLLILSGHPLEEVVAGAPPPNVRLWLQKPLSMEALATAVAQVLDGGGKKQDTD